MESRHKSHRKSSEDGHSSHSPAKRSRYQINDDDNHSKSTKNLSQDNIDEDFSFTKYKYELNKVFIANPNLVQDTDDFWRFVGKYETIQKKLGKKVEPVVANVDLNSIGVPANYHKSHCININISLKFGEIFARVPQSEELSNKRLKQFKNVIVLYLDFKQKEKFNKLKKLRECQANLPVARYREEIVEAVKNEKVIIIAGDTGCGKSTQVPQYLYSAGFGKIGMFLIKISQPIINKLYN